MAAGQLAAIFYMKTIKMTRLVSSFTYGNCGVAETVVCSDAFAAHCVDTLKSAIYLVKPKQVRKTKTTKARKSKPVKN